MARITKSVDIRRQEIIDTARVLFIEKGFEKTSIADIMQSIDVAQGLMYHYFKSKTALYYAVIDEIVKEEAASKIEIISSSDGKAVDNIRELFKNQVKFYAQYGKLFQSFSPDLAPIEHAEKLMNRLTEPYIIGLLKHGNTDGSWNCLYPEVTARFILYGVSGIMNEPENIIESIMTDFLTR